MNELVVSALYTYPIKSCSGVSLTSAKIDARGLLHDRRWMLIDQNNKFISQREVAILSRFQVKISDHALTVTFNGEHKIIPFLTAEAVISNSGESVKIWGDTCSAIAYNDETNKWFSNLIGKPCRLVYMPDNSKRQVELEYASAGQITAFSDGYPILILGQESMNNLNDKLATSVSINRFRPNIVFTGGLPHIEDKFKKIRINNVILECVKLSRRCNVPNINQETSIAEDEPTKTLTQYRLFDNRILFGNNTLVHQHGLISLGDKIQLE